MKTINAFNTTGIFSIALIAGVLAVSSAYQAPVKGNNSGNESSDNSIQTVTIVAKRLSADEKVAYDQQTSPAIQTVLISAKRLTTEEKIAMDKDTLAIRQATAQSNKIIRQSV
ncbi:hypothetical protein QN372_12410 [Undibacterium sp. RTI2.1]|uniref:hypothetical protein n=1 Tax=unclassified Undibacterium TaxID=2630295 RepID=UPI002AB52A0C|nr:MULTISPECIES: hypothetical protein [unclassified Undibacterium]MDY7538343.1 hypothetical protein [Undibacterium sp. 5I1]MEB0031553.1 hypothetical protein [Undibacterium sp. RTI2.1]MEB0115033.1 hypothetical protein [Undibacterium sp. RTI2.2]MEB0229382.1 hypothetical protein [Undibacterium sp. 10I3]MEB0255992.1 hypothetical protein [Undibacterium sp. 5I1]